MGIRLPDDIAAFYRLCNGQNPDEHFLWEGREILSLERMVDEWTVWKELLDGGEFDGLAGQPEGPVKNDFYNPKWIHITHDGGGNHHCLDLDPAAGGKAGQIIEFWHDWEVRTLVAPSFSAWFEAFVAGCERGDIVWSEQAKSFIESDEE